MEITLKLKVDQVNVILSALGEMPVKTGVGQLMMEIYNQVAPQLPKEEPKEETKQ